MDLDFSDPEKVKIFMNKYTRGILKDFAQHLGKLAAMPDDDPLFQVIPDED